ncbi:MAG TPA: peptide chain release factor 2 [Methylomirabilota bacterium]|nr:peptide chain release factor 2 [Methylomirabilota bacterium]
MLNELRRDFAELERRLDDLRGHLDLPAKETRLAAIEAEMGAPAFWDDAKRAQGLIRERNELSRLVGRAGELQHQLGELRLLWEMATEEADESLEPEIQDGLRRLQQELREFELTVVLSGEHDRKAAIVSIHAGAGGTESQDWAQMLLRMYTRWAERRGYKVEVVDLLPGDEAGIKSVTLTVSGEYAYGYLKGETGVHRLVRISPFDAARRRHTSFASVSVIPEVEDVEVVVRDEDLRIDVFRSSGPGGQGVNTADSAVRVTHLPTGIVVSCQNERSQLRNRDTALRVLRARLYQLADQERKAELERLTGEKKDIAFGSQIRSYIFAPYQLIKDHRTSVEIGNVEAVMDGEIDPFIESYLFAAAK